MLITRNLRVKVAIPSTGTWDSDFGMCVACLVHDFYGAPWRHWDSAVLALQSKVSSFLPNSREQFVQQAAVEGCSHVLFIDSDQLFPSDTLRRLLRWEKPVVAVNIATKKEPSRATARRADGSMIVTAPGQTGIEEVGYIGTGVMLIDLFYLRKVPEPWFPVVWSPERRLFIGEDWGFINVLKEHKIPVYVDHELSQEVLHVGKKNFAIQDVEDDLATFAGPVSQDKPHHFGK